MSLQNSSNFPKITAGLAIASSLLVGCGGVSKTFTFSTKK